MLRWYIFPGKGNIMGTEKRFSRCQELGLGGGADHKEQQKGVWGVRGVEPFRVLIMHVSMSVTSHHTRSEI